MPSPRGKTGGRVRLHVGYQDPCGFGASYRGFLVFPTPSNFLKTAKLRRIGTMAKVLWNSITRFPVFLCSQTFLRKPHNVQKIIDSLEARKNSMSQKLSSVPPNHSLINYSQTGCSFDGNFANFLRNIGIWLTVWVDQVAIRASKLLYRFRAVFKIIWKAVCYSKFLLWLMMANIHYNRITRLKKGENNCPVHVWSIQNRNRSQKLDYRLKLTVSKYWIGNRKLNVYLLRYNYKRNSCSPRRFYIILQCKHVTYGSFE